MKLAEMIKLGVKGFKPSDIKAINESGISTDEIINLAENGYSTADVNELIALAGSGEELQPGNNAPSEPQGPAVPAENNGEESKDDYIEKIREQDAKIVNLTKQLEAAQTQNSRRSLSQPNQITPRDQIREAFMQIY